MTESQANFKSSLNIEFKKISVGVKGIASKSIATHRRSRTLATMATLNSFEYDLAISTLLKQDIKVLESIQDKWLCMIVGGHATSSTIVLKHICNLPSMKFCTDVLIAKFCIRSRFLPAQCLLSLLHHHHTIYSTLVSLGKTNLLSHLPPTLKLQSPSAIKNHFESIIEAGFTTFLQSNTQVLIQACHPVLGVDPILFLLASHVKRGRLIRWRMGWLLGKPKECPCGSDHTSRPHLLDCPLVCVALFEQLPQPDQDQIHRIDFAITSLPLSSQEPRPAYWIPLLTILWDIYIICNPDGDYSHETEHAEKWRAGSAIEATTVTQDITKKWVHPYKSFINPFYILFKTIHPLSKTLHPLPLLPYLSAEKISADSDNFSFLQSQMSTLLPSSVMQGMSPDLASFLGNMQTQFISLQQCTNELESPAATNARLTAQLVNAEKLITDLRSQLASQGNYQITTNASTSSAPTTPKEPGTEASTWATTAAAAHNSVVVPTALSVRKTPRPPSVCQVTASARIFVIPTGSKGYQYVYIPRSRCLTHREVCNSLKTLGVDTGCILDINFPAKDVVGILVHNQYAEKFQTTLTTVAIEILDVFDPLDPKNIADHKYKSLSDSELEEVAAELHSDRCLKALKYLCPHVAVSVGHFFCDQGWISKEDIPVHSVSGPGADIHDFQSPSRCTSVAMSE
ncbi:hypothetical protein PHYBLDRAFT_153359 [Phycomyces blakesleeanus NRRL 1555(-)]|uniref:Uncharacterized protein n=1 Tax=Phycomyces blakesleeanus (strain ATCC 8743b / DSM 1359 / FGSC 10004 / NBRC 33097 / NRRL 1555) TaxID=763407 RepID=A0A163CTB1_PHYB8|nr:hypothetical protein PHYBLDRAFT_153359 [Phycomyces blakesleeanus NRRL 1555(-)]OAD65460.1 hypothetical protein PHYBLDRAFT_153359 [Phycomyces blakesleeanus NRRL 1555(-)]|eukprot:XP_018283500.1 hypothetical protein PHYBLDRAFT_153359 [Phycomyces blakesleeanus NRRL 1555(-)]